MTAAASIHKILTMSAVKRYAACLAAPLELADFDTALGAIMSDLLSGRITGAQAVALEDDVRNQREEFIMRRGR